MGLSKCNVFGQALNMCPNQDFRRHISLANQTHSLLSEERRACSDEFIQCSILNTMTSPLFALFLTFLGATGELSVMHAFYIYLI